MAEENNEGKAQKFGLNIFCYIFPVTPNPNHDVPTTCFILYNNVPRIKIISSKVKKNSPSHLSNLYYSENVA